MKKKRKDVIVSRLEGQSNDFTLQRYGIFRFPVVALFKPNSKHIYSIFQNQRVFDELNKWVNDTCPVIDDKKEKNIIYHKIASFKVNMTEIESNQNLTTENEYIKNEFIDINKRIEQLKIKLNLISDNKKNKENTKIKFEFEISPIFLLLSFIVILLIFTVYSFIKKYFFTNKEHIK